MKPACRLATRVSRLPRRMFRSVFPSMFMSPTCSPRAVIPKTGGFGDCGSVSGLVKVIRGQGKVRHFCVADNVCPDVADAALKFDSVDVFHMFFLLMICGKLK